MTLPGTLSTIFFLSFVKRFIQEFLVLPIHSHSFFIDNPYSKLMLLLTSKCSMKPHDFSPELVLESVDIKKHSCSN